MAARLAYRRGGQTMIGKVGEGAVAEELAAPNDAAAGGGAFSVARRERERQWDIIAVVAVGGVLGSEARYGLAEAVPHAADAFPWSTIYINVIGCFFLGALMALLGQLAAPRRLLRPFVGIGILGGFTTFSTFTVDAERLIEHHRAGIAGLYVLCTLIAAALAVAAGTIMSQLAGRYMQARHRQRMITGRTRGQSGARPTSGRRR